MKPRKAECIQICESDGAQYYRVRRGHGYDYDWLCGIDKAKGVKVGDMGTMEYRSTATRGYHRFVKDEEVK